MGVMPEAIFFDAAGTLLTVAEPVGISYSRIAAQHGLVATPEAVTAGFRSAWKSLPDPLHPEGSPPADDDRSWWRGLVDHTFTHAIGEKPAVEPLEAAFQALYSHFALPEAWVLYPDTLPAIRSLVGRTRLLILSNFDRRLPPLLDHFGLGDCFEKILISSEIGASKPHPRMFQAALDAVGHPPSACLHVGDDLTADIQGAEAAGIPQFHVSRPDRDLLKLVESLSGV
jgi:putative hydrolase of the HAD superfamily